MGRSNIEKNNRIVELLEVIKRENKISVKELSEMFSVSPMTIRRDLEILRKNHIIERSYGSASLVMGGNEYAINGEVYDLRRAKIQNLEQKDAIAKHAASLIEAGDFIFLDNGTTVSRIGSFLPTEFEFTVLCYNYIILSEVLKHPNIKTIFPGGYYYPEDQTFTSDESVEFIARHRANKAFISASGIHRTLGITCINGHSTNIKEAIIHSAAERILMADSSKFDLVKTNHFADLEAMDLIISDSNISKEWIDLLNEKDIRLELV